MTAVERREQDGNAWAKRMIDEALRLRDKERELLTLRSELRHAEKRLAVADEEGKPVVEKQIEQIKAEMKRKTKK